MQVQCSLCYRWCHCRCCGYDSLIDAIEADYNVCLSCSCYYFKENPIKNNKTNLIVLPDTLLSQWNSEIAKHIDTSK